MEVAAPSPHATRPTGAGGAVHGRTLVATTELAERLFAARLYVITPDAAPERLLQIATAAVRGGADVIQLRQKNLARGQLLDLARKVREVTQSGPLFIVNDFVDIALLCEADGVHLGPDDLSIAAARRVAGERLLIGASASTIGMATVLWLIVMQIISSSMGGYLAGRLRTKWANIHTDEVYFRDTAHGFLA